MGADSSSRTVHRPWRARKNHYGEQEKSRSHSRTDKRSLPPRRAARPAPPRARPAVHAPSCTRQVPFPRTTNLPCHEY